MVEVLDAAEYTSVEEARDWIEHGFQVQHVSDIVRMGSVVAHGGFMADGDLLLLRLPQKNTIQNRELVCFPAREEGRLHRWAREILAERILDRAIRSLVAFHADAFAQRIKPCSGNSHGVAPMLFKSSRGRGNHDSRL